MSAAALKMLSDLGFYLTLAGWFGGLFGAAPGALFSGWAALTAAFAVSWLFRDRGLRFLPLVPALAALVLTARRPAEYALLLPAALYALYLAGKRRYEPTQDRTRELFSLFWKLFPVPVLIGLLAGKGALVSALTLPAGFVTLLSLVLLTRALRHSPEVRSSPRYQLTELAAVLAAGGAAWLFSSPAALRLLGAGFRAAYTYVLGPVLYALIWLILAVIQGLVRLVSLLRLRFGGRAQEPQESPEPAVGESPMLQWEEVETDPAAARVFAALGILLAAALLFLFFRWLARRAGAERTAGADGGDRRAAEAPVSPAAARERPGGSVGRVRAAYRKFLKHCAAQGIPRAKSDTSLEVQTRCGDRFPAPELSDLRALYLRARYGGTAGKEDAARARELLARLKRK